MDWKIYIIFLHAAFSDIILLKLWAFTRGLKLLLISRNGS